METNKIMDQSLHIMFKVVYINGRPFVLREVERPFSNLEYTGINRARVEQMEDRLKEDILLEAARYGNKILVTDELPDGQIKWWINGSQSHQLCQNITTGIPRTNSIGTISVCGSNATDNMLNTEDALLRGEYTIIRSLIRVLEGGFPVYGVANPTVERIKSVMQRIGSSKGGVGRPVFWHNMREEPVIYINGKPFLLREVERPYKNMLEYTGIDCERVERMEARLKEDILKESECYGCKVPEALLKGGSVVYMLLHVFVLMMMKRSFINRVFKFIPEWSRWLELDLKLVTDIGIVGAPNARKSMFLSVISVDM
ncbi:unnamed protein product [Lactuca virosa]|uniref:Uncharacterized protein n=1 Tax=Lactuca virosa TaxID=75947 RepID=A0AAU9N057_9ASTR|nr:unnamed protein product [Lactuca virosa]